MSQDTGMIGNRDELERASTGQARSRLLDVVESTLSAMHPRSLLDDVVTRSDDRTLVVNGTTYDLSEYGHVYVTGAGKGALPLVEATTDIVGGALTEAIAVEKRGQGAERDDIEVVEADHPVPSDASLDAGRAVIERARSATADDLVFVCITGGASSLLAAPAGDLTVSDLATVTDELLRAGARIEELNAVRKHLSEIKGGRLATHLGEATVVGLIVVDEVQGDPWGPTVPDETTYETAIEALKRNECWSSVPTAVRAHLERGAWTPAMETPVDQQGRCVQNVVLADAEDLCLAAQEFGKRAGFSPTILSTMIEGESAEAGIVLAGIAKEVAANGRPVEPPCLLISSGETIVTVTDDSGEGGPNQEFAVSFGIEIDGWSTITALSVGTDGTDGPTEVAGGIVDGKTIMRANEAGVDLREHLAKNDTTPALEALGNALYTGSTDTNVMDLRLVHVGEQERL
jgi:glycerate-2-kinase